MGQIFGLTVRLEVMRAEGAGTNDQLYVGLLGTEGGREFALGSSRNDFEAGSHWSYVLGLPEPLPSVNVPMIRSNDSRPGARNDPGQFFMTVEGVQSVYLRKQAYGTGGDDDAVNLRSVTVWVRDHDDAVFAGRQFFARGIAEADAGLWLANEYGHQVWLQRTFF